jgi:hypothetical protein
VSKVKDMKYMFAHSNFNGDLSKWKVKIATNIRGIFDDCPLRKNPPTWYKEK